MRICKYPECQNKHEAKGYCNIHYKRLLQYGDPSVFKYEHHGKHGTPEHIAWCKMKSRCMNSNTKAFKNYGGRGIVVCDRWQVSFMAFYQDMGPIPFPRAQIDRINNNGNYEPNNCRWTTCKINIRNSKVVKLNMEKAKEIRRLYETGEYTQKKLGKLFGVHRGTIEAIIQNKTWNE